MMIDLTLVVIAKNEQDMVRFNTAHVKDCDLHLCVNDGLRTHPNSASRVESLAEIGNRFLRWCGSRVFGFCHADMEFGRGSLEAFVECSDSTFPFGAVCGACGRTKQYRDAGPGLQGCSSYVWSKDWGEPTLRQVLAGYPLNPAGPCPVSTLDSSCIFFPTDLGLKFDEKTFDGFHCHGEDICLQAQSRGIPVLVPAANAWHACSDVNGPNWGKERDVYYRRLKAKWPQLEFATT